MSSVLDYMQLCRLCLVKDKVNVPIFGESSDVGQIFFKITACLPIKVSQNDNLPKKICDTCLYKVDLLYQFWNTTVNAEKQLLQWLGEIGVEVNLKKSEQSSANHTNQHSIQDEPLVLKEERNEADAPSADAVQQPFTSSKPVAFKSYDQLNETNIKAADIREDAVEETSLSSSTNVQLKPEVSEKRLRSRTAAIKKEEIHIKTTSTNNNSSADEPMDEDSSEKLISQEESDSSMDAGERIAKEEAESEEEYEDTAESLEPTAFVGVPSDSACDTDQPGPSGLNKPVTSTDTGVSDNMEIITPEGNIKCLVCSREFNNRTKFTKHKRNHARKVIPCRVCGKMFRFAYQIRAHEKTHNATLKYKCEPCNKKFKTVHGLKFHERSHLADYKYKCKECGKGFHHKSTLQHHFEVQHKGVRYECDKCSKMFMSASYYQIHLRSHDPLYLKQKRIRKKKLFMCDLCGKTLTTQSSLDKHMLIHTGERPFVCNVCGKTFNKRSVLVVHQRTHTKERPYICTHCDKTFTQRSTLVIHMRYHTGQRPYKCNICSKDFVSKSLMNNHSKVHGVKLSDA